MDCISTSADGYTIDTFMAIDPNKKWATFLGGQTNSSDPNATYTCPLFEDGTIDSGACRVSSSTSGNEYYIASTYDPFVRRVWLEVSGESLARQYRKQTLVNRFSDVFSRYLSPEDNVVTSKASNPYEYLKTCAIDSSGSYTDCKQSANVEGNIYLNAVSGAPDASGFYINNATYFNSTLEIFLSYCSNSLDFPCTPVAGNPFAGTGAFTFQIVFLQDTVAYLMAVNFNSISQLPLMRCSVLSPTEFVACSEVEIPIAREYFLLLRPANGGEKMYFQIETSVDDSVYVCDVDQAGGFSACRPASNMIDGLPAFSEPVIF